MIQSSPSRASSSSANAGSPGLGWLAAIVFSLLAVLAGTLYYRAMTRLSIVESELLLNELERRSLEQELATESLLSARHVERIRTILANSNQLELFILQDTSERTAERFAAVIWSQSSMSGLLMLGGDLSRRSSPDDLILTLGFREPDPNHEPLREVASLSTRAESSFLTVSSDASSAPVKFMILRPRETSDSSNQWTLRGAGVR